MSLSRIFPRVSTAFGRRSLLFHAPVKNQYSIFLNRCYDESPSKLAATQVYAFKSWTFVSFASQRLGFASYVETNEKDQASSIENNNAEISGEEDVANQTKEDGTNSEAQTCPSKTTRRRRTAKRTAFSDSDSESTNDLTRDELVKLMVEKEQILKIKSEEIEQMKDKVLRAYAEMENVMDRNKREAENSKKFAIQNFAKGLLDVADNLERASSVVKESFSKIDASEDAAGAVPLLKTLLDGVEMTEKQLAEVFKKFGVEKFDPRDKPFDPNMHNAVFQVPDTSKPAGTVAHVLKVGYMLYDRVIRPAEVGVTQAAGHE